MDLEPGNLELPTGSGQAPDFRAWGPLLRDRKFQVGKPQDDSAENLGGSRYHQTNNSHA